MRVFTYIFCLLISTGLGTSLGYAADDYLAVRMDDKAEAGYFVKAHIPGYGEADFMVDTGSGFVTINEKMLETLQTKGLARFIRSQEGVLADGSSITVPLYMIKTMSIGSACVLQNIEVAVFDSDTPCILGMSALRKTAPFVFSMDPPQLMLSNCQGGAV